MGIVIDKNLDINEVCKRYNQKLVFEPEAHSRFFYILTYILLN